MKIYIYYIFLGPILLPFIFGISLAGNIINIPVHPLGKEIKSFTDKNHDVYSKSYIIINNCEENDLISFYSAELKKHNFLQVEAELSKNGWINFVDLKNGKKLHVCQFLKEWVNRDEREKAILLLEYKSYDTNQLRDKLFVTLQIMPTINKTLLNDFYKEIDDAGEFEDFMSLLEKYETSDGNVDFSRAISENPNNKYLRRYQQILHDAYP